MRIDWARKAIPGGGERQRGPLCPVIAGRLALGPADSVYFMDVNVTAGSLVWGWAQQPERTPAEVRLAARWLMTDKAGRHLAAVLCGARTRGIKRTFTKKERRAAAVRVAAARATQARKRAERKALAGT